MVSELTTWYQIASLESFLWEKAISPALSTPHLAVVLCRKLRSHENPPLHICMFLVSSLSKSFSVKYGDELVSVVSLTFPGDKMAIFFILLAFNISLLTLYDS